MRRWTRTVLVALASTACWTSARLDLGPTAPGVTLDARVQYYDVNAGSLVELRRALMTEGPLGSGGRRWAAVTSWRMQWTYHYVGNITCVIENTQVGVQTAIAFPRWNPTSTPDSALAEWWFQYRAGLAEHEAVWIGLTPEILLDRAHGRAHRQHRSDVGVGEIDHLVRHAIPGAVKSPGRARSPSRARGAAAAMRRGR